MICLGCLKERKTKKDYCEKCIKELFDGISPVPLDFNKKEFYKTRFELAPNMSIPGVQDKISLKFNGNKLVPTTTKGKYILKPFPLDTTVIKNAEDLPANEHLSMLISQNIFKIKTANCALVHFKDGELAYITKRFDYVNSKEKFDQEDFASILGVTSAKDGADYKYSSKTYLDCINAIKLHSPASKINILDFVKRVIMNYLISNGDAHLKNFSLYSIPNKNDFMLTPNYDVLNTRYHVVNENSDIAMDLFSESTKEFDVIGFLTFYDFKKFASLSGLSDKQFTHIIGQASNIDGVEELINSSYLSKKGKEYYLKNYKDRLYKRVLYRLDKKPI